MIHGQTNIKNVLEVFTPTAPFHCSLLHPFPQQEAFGYVKVVLTSWNRLLFYLEAKNYLNAAVLKKTGSDQFSHLGLVLKV